ncbi:MAG: Single-stranded-DNA-specific exonuclease RecJ [Bacteriovoracaceae bacterium]|nr:Single-stranded-DNA-specific exonuclease RecJ [Bacteriovoracaceae bacterium]
MGGYESSFLPDAPALLREVLWKRGFRSNDEATRFLYPSLSAIPSPLESLKDLPEAISLLLKARDTKDLVVIFGDYDVDGTTSTVLLYTVFKEWKLNVDFFIPHRVNEGYGVTLKAAKKLLKEKPETKLIVTCDCGVASFEGIEFLRSQNISVIVTDHHEVPSTRVNANAVLNPKQKDCHYPDKKLAGVGVAFLLVIGLRRALDLKDFSLSSWLDLVAVGTVCDVAELTGANRIFVRLGLQKLQTTERQGFKVMLRNQGLEGNVLKSRDLGFVIGPRLNAAGRIGEPTLGVNALLAKTEAEAYEYVSVLEKHNTERRELQASQMKEALEIAEKKLRATPHLKTIVIADPTFHLGIVGLLAARIAENFKRPACVLTELQDEHALADFEGRSGIWKGSLRTPPGHHLSEALAAIRIRSPELLLSGGGHALAAGVAISYKDLSLFEAEFEHAISHQVKIHIPTIVDARLGSPSKLQEVISLLEPFGNGNPPPLLLVEDFKLDRVQLMKDIHLKLHGTHHAAAWSVLHFKSPWVKLFSPYAVSMNRDLKIDFLAELSENEWMGNKRIELVLKDLLEMRVSGKRFEIQRPNEISESQSSREAGRHSYSDSTQS